MRPTCAFIAIHQRVTVENESDGELIMQDNWGKQPNPIQSQGKVCYLRCAEVDGNEEGF